MLCKTHNIFFPPTAGEEHTSRESSVTENATETTDTPWTEGTTATVSGTEEGGSVTETVTTTGERNKQLAGSQLHGVVVCNVIFMRTLFLCETNLSIYQFINIYMHIG